MSVRSALTKASRSVPRHVQKPVLISQPSCLIYADKAIIAINKPPGLICQSNKSYEKQGKKSAFDQLLEDLKVELSLDDLPKQVHRLDKLTTGAYLFAKSNTQARALSQQFRDHSLKKTYLAIVRGGRKTFPDSARGSINAPLKVVEEKVVVDEKNGVPALTDWELLGSSWILAPILGDALYSSKAPPKNILELVPKSISVSLSRDGQETKRTPSLRLFLHSAHIDVTRYRSSGPSKRLRLGISAPLPWYFLELCKAAKLSQYLPSEYIHGGLMVDGVPVNPGEGILGLDGKWLGA
ncbi:pseudouridine synthase [Sanghuangporus baumii]|uniref:21S rRNA pseudouridine(2819) synthase n=1 Tax=Sanghuangporus baumii TaxID=108892 RepID=A0A9Q5HXP6_SANBA|nr:pseudouridine synthase [Sanghuangporus baumii]